MNPNASTSVWHRHSMGRLLRLLTFLFAASHAYAGDTPVAKPDLRGAPIVHVAAIDGVIDLGLAPYVARVIAEAKAAGALAVVLEINTFGGRVDAAVQIRDSLLDSQITTIAFVNRRAISAGALISLAAEHIFMAGGGTIGAATPVQAGQPGAGAQPVQEKTVSYVRKEFSATAQSRGRPSLLAEAMVDADVEIAGVVEKGKLLTLTTDDAVKLELARRADRLEDALALAGFADATVVRTSLNWAEQVVRVLTHPVISPLLITIAMLGIIVEIRTPGFGIPGALGVGSLGLFLWGHWLVQLAGWEELMLMVAGLALLAAELFVIPGFGIAGILGIIALLASLVLSLVGPGYSPEFLMLAATRVGGAIVLALLVSLLFLRWLPRLPFGRALVLETELASTRGWSSAREEPSVLLGQRGITHSALRPAGIGDFGNLRVDVVSEGDMVESGVPIEVIRVDGNRVVVRQIGPRPNKE